MFPLRLTIFHNNSIYCQSSSCYHNCQRKNCLPTMTMLRGSCLVYLDKILLYHRSTHQENWVRTGCCTSRHNSCRGLLVHHGQQQREKQKFKHLLDCITTVVVISLGLARSTYSSNLAATAVSGNSISTWCLGSTYSSNLVTRGKDKIIISTNLTLEIYLLSLNIITQ